MLIPEHAEADLIERLAHLSQVPASAFAEEADGLSPVKGTIGEALGKLRSLAEEGQPLASAALRIAGHEPMAIEDLDDVLPEALYEAALAAVERGDGACARALLLAALVDPAREPDGCLGLASLALHGRAFEEAALLCERCLELRYRHPRVCAILGFIRARYGRTDDAKTLLAAAARIARRDPRLRVDLDAAQRTLLLLQLAS